MKKLTSLAIASALSASVVAGMIPTMFAEEAEKISEDQKEEEEVLAEDAENSEEEQQENDSYADATTIKHVVCEGLSEDKGKAVLKLVVHREKKCMYPGYEHDETINDLVH